MTSLLADCFEIEAALLNMIPDTSAVRKDSIASWYGYILEKQNLEPDEFKEEIRKWQTQPEEWGRLLDSTESVLQNRRNEQEGNIEE